VTAPLFGPYIAAAIAEPGLICHSGALEKLVFGPPKHEDLSVGGRSWVRTSDPSFVRRKQRQNRTSSQNQSAFLSC
jgi:hypothetical protein